MIPQFSLSPRNGPAIAEFGRSQVFVVLLVGLFVAGVLLGQPADPDPEFPVNNVPFGPQVHPRVAMHSSGSFVVVWGGYPDEPMTFPPLGYGVFARRFDDQGAPMGFQFQVNTYTTGRQQYPAVAMDSSGGFVVVWESEGQDGSYDGIFGRRFNPAGVPQGGEFAVNTYTTNRQTFPAVAMDPSGNFVVFWESRKQVGVGDRIFGQRFDPLGNPQGGEFQLNTYPNHQANPRIAMDPLGNFVVVWAVKSQDGSGYGVFGQRFGATGTPQGVEFAVNTYTTYAQGNPEIAMSASGNFAVVWNSDRQDGSGDFGVFGQIFASTGLPVGEEFQVHTFTSYTQGTPSVAMDDSGAFVVAWMSRKTVNDFEILGQRFDETGTRQGGEFAINTYSTGHQLYPAIGTDSSGDFVVVWQSYPDQDGSSSGIFGRWLPCPDAVDEVAGLEVAWPNGGADLIFTWTDATNAEDYVVLEDDSPAGAFDTITGIAPSGLIGLTVPTPPGNRFYLVAGRNSACGLGPK